MELYIALVAIFGYIAMAVGSAGAITEMIDEAKDTNPETLWAQMDEHTAKTVGTILGIFWPITFLATLIVLSFVSVMASVARLFNIHA